MKRNSLFVCLSVSGSKVKRTLVLQLLKTLLYLHETKVAGAENVWGVAGGVTPLKIEIFFFFPKLLYLVETKVAGAENVWGVTTPSKSNFFPGVIRGEKIESEVGLPRKSIGRLRTSRNRVS
jgi:hypothetical protein